MHLMYYLKDGKRVYTLKKEVDGQPTVTAHPEHPIPADAELWLFKVPKTLPFEKLSSIEIPKSSSKELTVMVGKNEYTIKPMVEKGELADLEFIGPSANGYKKGYSFKRYYSIEPTIDISTTEELKEVGEKIKNQEYVPREQPQGLKLQSEPSGFNTDEKVLKKVLKRYRQDTSVKKSPKKSKK